MDLSLTYSHASASSDHVGGVEITRVRDPVSKFECYVYQCSLEEDFDGAPDAYGWDNPNPVDPAHNPDTRLQQNVNGRDHIPNATNNPANCRAQLLDGQSRLFAYVGLYATSQTAASRLGISIDRRARLEARQQMRWVPHIVGGKNVPQWELVTLGPKEEGIFPVIQGPGRGPMPGHFVSSSSGIADATLPEYDQNRYINANEIPYAAWAGWWRGLNVELGDFGFAFSRNTGAASGFVFGDSGSGRVGEVSKKLLSTLTRDGGDNESKFNFMVFPRSGRGVAGGFSQEAIVQSKAREFVSKLQDVEGASELLALMAFDMNLSQLRRWAPARDTDAVSINRAGRYDTAAMALSGFGFSG